MKIIWNLLSFIGLLTVLVSLFVLYFLWKNNLFPVVRFLFENRETVSSLVTKIDYSKFSVDKKTSVENTATNSDTPISITPDMEKCFVEKLGQARVNEIKAGAETTVADFAQAGVCLE